MASVTTDTVRVGNLQIPAENFPEWERLNNEAHDLMVAGKPVCRAIEVQMFVLQGASQAVAAMLADVAPGYEEHDTPAMD